MDFITTYINVEDVTQAEALAHFAVLSVELGSPTIVVVDDPSLRAQLHKELVRLKPETDVSAHVHRRLSWPRGYQPFEEQCLYIVDHHQWRLHRSELQAPDWVVAVDVCSALDGCWSWTFKDVFVGRIERDHTTYLHGDDDHVNIRWLGIRPRRALLVPFEAAWNPTGVRRWPFAGDAMRMV